MQALLKLLYSTVLATPLGSMLAVADEQSLYLLDFADTPSLDRKIKKLCTHLKATILPGNTQPIISIQAELELYFKGALKEFKTNISFAGSPFQKHVWSELLRVPYGNTISYSEEAKSLGKETACRAVANANGSNQLAIIIPCHRIIRNNGSLGGYAGGILRKQWLIDHELCHKEN